MELPSFLKNALEEPLSTPLDPMEGKKHKPRFDLIPALPLYQVAKAFTFGVEKHHPYGWVGADRELYLAAALRHINAYHIALQNEDTDLPITDSESGLHALAHAAASLLILIALDINRGE